MYIIYMCMIRTILVSHIAKVIATMRVDKVIEIERLVSIAASLDVPKSGFDRISEPLFPRTDAFYPILDAIAILCVKKVRKEAYACGIQVDDATSNIRLTLVADSAVPCRAVGHIRDLWVRLKRLSNIHELDDVDHQTIAEHRNSFREAVFTYSMKRQVHMFYKHFDALQTLSIRVQHLRDNSELSHPTDLAGWFVYFDGCLHVMMLFREIFLRDRLPRLRDARKMGVVMEVLRVFVAHLLMNEPMCDYVSQPANSRAERFPLEDHLRELVLLPRSVRALMEFASNPRNNLYFSYRLSIKMILVSNNPGHFLFPVCWEDFVDSRFPKLHPVPPKVIQGIHHAFSGQSDVQRKPHCECTLAAYFYILKTKPFIPWSYIPPLEYLGTSKASCAACLVYLDALRNFPGAPPLYSRGLRGKWLLWSCPLYIRNRRLIQAVYEKMHEEVSRRLGIVLREPSPPPGTLRFDS